MFSTAAKGLVGLLGAGALALGMSGDAKGGIINVYNYASGVGNQVINLKNITSGLENYDSNDSTYLDPTQTTSLKIYTKVSDSPTGKLSIDARPVDTLGWDFDLGVKGSVTDLINAIKFKPTEMTDLTGKTLSAYDYAHPETVYPITNGLNSVTTINLPILTYSGTEPYAHWRLDVNDVPEPSTGEQLLGAGALALGAWGVGRYLSRGRKGVRTAL